MNPFSKEPREMTLDEMIAELAWSDSGELKRYRFDTDTAAGIIRNCCQELRDLAQKAEVIGWLPVLEGEALGKDFFSGVGHMMDDIQHRLWIVEAIIHKATAELEKTPEAP